MGDHARLSPSNHRWPYCAGSPREEEKYPDIPGEAAIDGTGSHILLELAVENSVPAKHYDQLIIGSNHEDRPNGWLVDIERCERVQICIDYIDRRKKELTKQFPGCIVHVETESRSNPGTVFDRDDWWGTCDITIMVFSDDKVLFIEVVDYKDGRMYVSEKWNSQLVSYLMGKIAPRMPSAIPNDIGLRMTIVQPKTSTPIRYQCSTNPDSGLNITSFNDKVQWLAERAAATDDPNAPLTPGKHCTWCKHNPKRGGTCTASTEKSMEVINDMTTEIKVTGDDGILDFISQAVSDVKSLTAGQLVTLADSKAGFMTAFDKVFAEIQERIESGVPVPGYAMVPGKASKAWNVSPEEVEKKLKAKRIKKGDIYPSKLITPAAALKLPGLTDAQKKKIREELISEVAGKMTLKKVAYDHKDIKDVDAMVDSIETPAAELIMTAAANGITYQQYKTKGWTDQQMIDNGIAELPQENPPEENVSFF